MSEPVMVTGLVISCAQQGEYDRRLVLLTKERGKISAFARGARKSTSALVAATNVFSFGTFTLYEGRNSYTLVQANIKEHFTELAKAQPEVYFGFYFLELASFYAREGMEETTMINLLYLTLKALLSDKLDNQLIRVIFELKTLVINGEYPQVFACQSCGVTEDLTNLSIAQSGMFCKDCQSKAGSTIKISEATLYTLQYIISTPIQKVYTFAISDEVLAEMKSIMKQYLRRYVGKSFKTLEILEMMC